MNLDYVKFDDVRNLKAKEIRTLFEQIIDYADNNIEDGRSASLFYTKLEEAYMWCLKAVRDEQLKNKELSC